MATLLLIHDLHPVPLEHRVQDALDSVRPYMESHGGNVELLSRRGRRRPDPPARQLLGLLGVVGHARAGDQAGARGGGARPGGARGRGRRPQTAAAGLPMVTQSPPTGSSSRGDPAAPQPLVVRRRSRSACSRTGRWPRSASAGSDLVVANVDGTLLAYRDRCASCGGALHDGRAVGRRAGLPRVRAVVLPPARGPVDGRRPAAARAGAAAARGGPRQGGARRSDATRRPVADAVAARRRADVVSGLRGGSARAATRRSPRRARHRRRPTDTEALRSLRHRHPRGPPPPAARWPSAGSCARARRAGRCARARATTARPATGRCGCRASTSPTRCGRASRSRSGWRSSWSRRSPRAWSRCTRARAGATETELHFESWSRMVELNPVLDDLEPDIEGLIVNRLADPPHVRDRADRPLLRAHRHDQGAPGRGSPAAPASSRRSTRFFDELRAEAARGG